MLRAYTHLSIRKYPHKGVTLSGDELTVKRLTISNYEGDLRRRLRQQNPNYAYVWKFHGENRPAKVVSIRAEEVNHSSKPITYGNRLLVQACVKFDTMQVRAALVVFRVTVFIWAIELGSLHKTRRARRRRRYAEARRRIPCLPEAHVVRRALGHPRTAL